MSRVALGKVIGGKVVLEGEPLPEGSQVAVWIEEGDGFELDEMSLRELSAADASCERGEGISVEELRVRLARPRSP